MRCLIAVLLVAFTAAPASAKSYSAERFDSRIRVLAGGAIEVVETVVFRFETGSFEHVFREIPSRRTDGVEVVSASMDGRDLQFGKQPGQVEVQARIPGEGALAFCSTFGHQPYVRAHLHRSRGRQEGCEHRRPRMGRAADATRLPH